MTKFNKVIAVTLLNVTLLGCSDSGRLQEELDISTDIKIVHDGLVRYHEFNSNENCPSVATLIDNDFINNKPSEYGTLTRPISLYKIKNVSEEMCEISVKMGEQLICSEYEIVPPEFTRLSCNQERTLKLIVNVKTIKNYKKGGRKFDSNA